MQVRGDTSHIHVLGGSFIYVECNLFKGVHIQSKYNLGDFFLDYYVFCCHKYINDRQTIQLSTYVYVIL